MNYFYDILPDDIRHKILKIKQQDEHYEKCRKYLINELQYVFKGNLWVPMDLFPSMLLRSDYLRIIFQFEQRLLMFRIKRDICRLSNFAKQNGVSILEGRRLFKQRVMDRTYIRQKIYFLVSS